MKLDEITGNLKKQKDQLSYFPLRLSNTMTSIEV